VHLHLYYEEQFDIFAQKIKSALSGRNYSLFITINECNDEIKQKFLSFKSDAKFIIVKNIGADIFPFITVLNLVNLEDYDYVIKLHTKNFHRKVGLIGRIMGKDKDVHYLKNLPWNREYSSFLTAKNIEKIFFEFEKDKKLGIVADHYVISKNHRKKRNRGITAATKNLLKSQGLPAQIVTYPIGTMFIGRAALFNSVKKLNLDESHFHKYKDKNFPTSFPNSMEQFIGNCANANGFTTKDVYNSYFHRFVDKLQHVCQTISLFLFRIDKGFVKIFKIPVFKIRTHT